MEVLPPGAERIGVTMHSPPDHSQVRIGFGRMLNFIILPREHAIQFAIMVLEHCGAEITDLKARLLEPPVDKP